MFNRRLILTAVDIGTSKVCVAIASSEGDGRITVLGHGEEPLRMATGSSPGVVCKGEIFDMPEVTMAVTACIAAAIDSAGCNIDPNNIFLSITGAHLQSMQNRGVTHIRHPDRKVTQEDVDNAMESAKSVNFTPDLYLLDHIDSYYVLDDGARRVSEPVGQVANKLEAFVHLVYGDQNRVLTTVNALHEVGFDQNVETTFAIFADCFGVLSEERKAEGVLLVDIGAGITEYLLLQDGCVHASGVLPVGTEHIANDLHLAFGISIEEARKLALQRELFEGSQSKNTVISVPANDGRRRTLDIPIGSVEKVIDERVSEMAMLIQENLKLKNNNYQLRVPVVLTGGGALHAYIPDIFSKTFGAPVSIGKPIEQLAVPAKLESPRYATLYGLLVYGDVESRVERPGIGRHLTTWIKRTKSTFGFMRNIFGKGDEA